MEGALHDDALAGVEDVGAGVEVVLELPHGHVPLHLGVVGIGGVLVEHGGVGYGGGGGDEVVEVAAVDAVAVDEDVVHGEGGHVEEAEGVGEVLGEGGLAGADVALHDDELGVLVEALHGMVRVVVRVLAEAFLSVRPGRTPVRVLIPQRLLPVPRPHHLPLEGEGGRWTLEVMGRTAAVARAALAARPAPSTPTRLRPSIAQPG